MQFEMLVNAVGRLFANQALCHFVILRFLPVFIGVDEGGFFWRQGSSGSDGGSKSASDKVESSWEEGKQLPIRAHANQLQGTKRQLLVMAVVAQKFVEHNFHREYLRQHRPDIRRFLEL